MKYIFLIHSNITFIIAEKIIEYLNLNEQDLVFLLHRKYRLPRDFENIEKIDVPLYKAKPRSDELNTIEEWSKRLPYDFNLFVPHTRERLAYLLIQIKQCIEYNLIEEGSSTYVYKDSKLNILKHKLFVSTGLRRRMRFLDYSHAKFNTAYCINNRAFRGCKNKVVLPSSLQKNTIIEHPALLKPCSIIVFDGSVSIKNLSMQKCLDLLTLICNDIIKNKENIIFYKLHPEQLLPENKAEVEQIQSKFSNYSDRTFFELSEKTILEELLFINPTITIYNFISSVGFYASLLGNNVVSVSNKTGINVDKKIKKSWRQL